MGLKSTLEPLMCVSRHNRVAATACLTILGLTQAGRTQETNFPPSGGNQPARPNVLVILTDDQGWGDLSINGNTNLATPNIDSLARRGATLDYFYVCQVCAPTRAEFLTGRYYPQTGVSGVSRGEGRLNYDETTIADLFQQAGYATGCFGKWHNGTQPPYHPLDRGFDEFYGFTSGHWSHYFSPMMDRNGKQVRGKGFIVDDLTNQALAFIATRRDVPFFCYVPLNTPHSPMMVPDRFYQKFDGALLALKHREPAKEDMMMTRAALALCENIDWNVGRLLQQLERLGVAENTIVLFFSDNGPNSYRFNGGMKGRKGSIDEGGLRSPCFIRWTDHIPAGTTIDKISGAIDLLPTLTELAEINATTNKPLNGRSLVPLLFDHDALWPKRNLLSIKGQQVSVRGDRFRLDSGGQLFDIAADPGQLEDVSTSHPEVVNELAQMQRQHATEMAAHFAKNADRPFTVGYRDWTKLTARDGVNHGSLQRSSKAPNNSFFKDWSDSTGYITWDIEVAMAGTYEATLLYTCAPGNEGVTLKLETNQGAATQQVVDVAFDPPLYDKSKERVTQSHYFMKDFRPLSLGKIQLEKGRTVLTLKAGQPQGSGVVDVHSLDLTRVPPRP